jgi:hypothetical protein
MSVGNNPSPGATRVKEGRCGMVHSLMAAGFVGHLVL